MINNLPQRICIYVNGFFEASIGLIVTKISGAKCAMPHDTDPTLVTLFRILALASISDIASKCEVRSIASSA